MSERLFVLVPGTGTTLRWRRVDADGAAIASGVLVGEANLDVGDATRVTAIVPGSAVSMHWVEMPRASTQQAAAAARHMAADFVAGPVAAQHIAAAADAEPDGMRAIAIVERAQMQAWLIELARRGLDPDEIVPAPLLLPHAEGGVTTLKSGDMLLVRGPHLALEAEPALAEVMLRGRKAETINRDLLDLAATGSQGAPPLNLRQGEYRRARSLHIDRKDARRVGLLAAACVAALLGAQAVEALRYHFAANAIETEIEAEARRVLPAATAITDPLAQLNSRLQAAGMTGGFTGPASALFAALQASGNLRLESLRYTPHDGLRATLATPVGASLEPLRTRLAASGLNLVEGASRAVETGQRVDIEVSRR